MRACLLVVASLLCGACSADMTNSDTTALATIKTYTGPYSVEVVESTTSTSLQGGGTFPCTNTYTMSGTLTLTIHEGADATLGSAQVSGTQKETAYSSTAASCKAKGDLPTGWAPQLTGSTAELRFNEQQIATNGGYTVTSRTSFAGSLSDGVVTGVLAFSVSGAGTIGGVSAVVQNYSTSMNVTLR